VTAAALPRRMSRVADHWLDGTGDTRAVALLRIAAGPIVLLHLRPFLDAAQAGGSWDDTFWIPYASWYPAVSGAAWRALLWGCVVAAVLLSVGLFTRLAAAYTLGFVTWNLFLSQTHFHHNRAFLVVLLFALAALPVGRVMSLDCLLRRRAHRGDCRATGPIWPLIPVRFSVATAYWASGLSKLLDADWWGGTVLRLRIDRYGDVAASQGAPDWLLEALGSSGFMWWLAKVIVLTELFIGIGLLMRRSRLAAIWLAIPFHLAIEATADVQVFSLAGLCALVIWVTPRAGDRRLVVRAGGRAGLLGAAARRLDWTGRFAVVHDDGPGPALTLYDRAGGRPVVRHGAEAARMVLSRLPLTFPFAAPLLLPGVRSLWDRLTAFD
jgi:hypothetical protein